MKNVRRNKDQTSKELGKKSRKISRNERSEKQVVEKLKRSEEQYLDLFENANDAICILDSDLRFKEVNNKALKMFGYTKEELLDMYAFDIIPPAQIPRFEIGYKKLQEKGSLDYFVGKARTKDGRIIDVEISSSVIKDGDKITGTRDIIRDITERVQNQEALSESEDRYRTIIEYSNDMIWTLDTEGRFLFFNKRSEEITGFTLEKWRGKSFAPLIKKDDLPKIIDIFHKTLKGEPQQYEVSVEREDGGTIILLVNTAPLYSKGKVVGTVSFGRDITERKKAEEQIKESLNQKLKRSNKQKKLLSYLIEGTRGGKTRALILRHITEKSYNAHQLAKALNMDYKTITHHLKVLVETGMIIKGQDEYSGLYFIAENIESDLEEMDI